MVHYAVLIFFSLCPVPSLKFQFSIINPSAPATFAKMKLPKSFENRTTMLNPVYDLYALRIVNNEFVFNKV